MKISSVSNNLIRSFLIFIVVYLWASYYLHGFFLVIFVSLLVTAVIEYGLVLLSRRRQGALMISRKEADVIRQTVLQLKFMTKAQTLKLFEIALGKNFKCVLTQKKLVVYTADGQTDFFSLFHKTPVLADIVECVRAKSKDSAVIVAAESFAPDVFMFAKSLKVKIKLVDGLQVYNQILKPADTFPKTIVETAKPSKAGLAQLRGMVFAREHTKSYVITALIIFATSFLVHYSLYYVILASIVFGLALYTCFLPRGVKNLFDL